LDGWVMWKKWRLLGQITGQLQIIMLEKMKMIGRFEVLCSPPHQTSEKAKQTHARDAGPRDAGPSKF
jgi:hypothetical protein